MKIQALLLCSISSFSQTSLADEILESVQTKPQMAWGGEVSSEAKLDAEGMVAEVLPKISMSTIKGVPAEDMESIKIELPKVVQDQTIFNHISLDWNPHGHEPAMIYAKPHFDMHFYRNTIAYQENVDCQTPSSIDAELVPAGYFLPDPAAETSCVPQMGIHAVPQTDLVPGYDFAETFIYGYYGSDVTFFEPMITKEFLMGLGSISKDLNLPEALRSIDSRVPHHYSVSYDEKSESYSIRFADFRAGAPVEKPDSTQQDDQDDQEDEDETTID